jgi:hypothetical protein
MYEISFQLIPGKQIIVLTRQIRVRVDMHPANQVSTELKDIAVASFASGACRKWSAIGKKTTFNSFHHVPVTRLREYH